MTRGGRAGPLDAELTALVERYRLSAAAAQKLRRLLERLVDDPHAPSSIRDPRQIVDRHLADSLVALELQAVQRARMMLDLGSGAGLPGLALAAARPDAAFVLLEASARKCDFLERTALASGITNAQVVHARAESYAAGFRQHDLVTARAVARLDATVEYAAPLLRVGGTLVAWAGRRSAEVEMGAERAARELGLGELEVVPVQPFAQAQHRHLYLTSKLTETPSGFPRRPGMAVKRPLGEMRAKSALSGEAGRSSDRPRR